MDFDTADETSENYNTVTVRDRDTMEQIRLKVSDVRAYIEEKMRF